MYWDGYEGTLGDSSPLWGIGSLRYPKPYLADAGVTSRVFIILRTVPLEACSLCNWQNTNPGGTVPNGWDVRKEKWDAIKEFPEHPIPSEEREIPQLAVAAQTLSLPLIETYPNIVVCDESRHGS